MTEEKSQTGKTSAAVASNDQLEHSLLTAWLDSADVGLCTLDDAGLVVMLNRAACAMLGVDGPQMLNQPFQQAVSAVNFDPGVSDWLAKLRNFRKDGSLFVNELFISPVKDADGTVTHFVGIQHLETDQRPPAAA